MDPSKTLEYFESRREAIVDLIREIVDIESPSNDAARSREVVDWVEQQARATGIDVTIERTSVEDGDHIIIRAFESDAKCSMLLGHTDTVHPVGTQQQNPTRIDGDKFYGCGIFDMKSGIVMMLEALRYFAVTGTRPARPITIVLSCDEEVGSFTGRELVEREATKAEHCLVVEPSADGKVKTGRKGTGMFTVRTHGVPAHAGLEPEKGANAIVELARQIEHINAIARPEIGTTVNVTTIRGGTTTNVIPESAECALDVRFSSMAEAERVDAAVRSLEPIDPRVSIELQGDINRPPMERTDAVVELYKKARDIAASFDYTLDETQVGGASDGNFIGALGVPVLDGLGITGAGAHRLDEHILVSDIAKRATLISLLVSCG
ncbi:MAG: M20 family metallopeptidase [Pyrinomonadaceae bacterium]